MPFVEAKGEVHGPKHRFTARNPRSAAPANSDAAWLGDLGASAIDFARHAANSTRLNVSGAAPTGPPTAGSRPAGALREITAEQNSTNLPKPDANSSNGRKMLGTN